MINKHLLLKIFVTIATLFLPFTVVEASELDRYKDNETDTPYYAPLLFGVHGQKVKGEEEIAFSITSVSVNNEIVDITDNNEIYVSKDDAVRIAGKAEPKSSITVYFADKKIEVNARDDGSWLVLFSITNLNDSRYVVSAKNDSLRESIDLFTLVVGKGKQIVQPVLDTETSQISTFFDNKGEYLAYIFVILFSTALGWFLGSYSEKKKGRRVRIKTAKLRK